MESLIKVESLFLSIIIPVFNGEKYILRCIKSILSQELSKELYEIILINDGSQDKSLDICNALSLEYSHIIVLDQPNSGQGTARNFGMSIAKGKYITFVDIDDYFHPKVLKDICNILMGHSPEILVSRNTAMNCNGECICQPKYKYAIGEKYIGEKLLLDNYLPAAVWSKFYLAKFLKKNSISFLPNIIHEDIEMNLRSFAIATEIEFTNIVTYTYYWNPISTDRLMDDDKKCKSILSDLVIAHSYKHLENKYTLSPALAEYFCQLSNSLVVSVFLQLMKLRNHIAFSSIIQISQKTKELGLIPIHGRTRSRKMDKVAKLLFSYRWFDFLIKFRNRL